MEDLQEFERYMAHLSKGLGHAARHAGLRGYTTGLMSPPRRKESGADGGWWIIDDTG